MQVVLWLSVLLPVVVAVDRSNFKTCDQSGFCKRNRAMQPGNSPYVVLKEGIKETPKSIEFKIKNIKEDVEFNAKFTALKHGAARFQLAEANPIRKRWTIPMGDVLVEPPKEEFVSVDQNEEAITLTWDGYKAVINKSPFKIDISLEGQPLISANGRGLMKFEHFRTKKGEEDKPEVKEDGEQQQDAEEVPADESEDGNEQPEEEPGMWEETFKTHTDTKPYGPSSVGMDFSFPGVEHVYGIPEHADSLALKSTKDGEPYRLYNLDVFEYELWNPMALYGAVPLMYAHNSLNTVGLFWLNPSETWVDILSTSTDKSLFSRVLDLWKSDEIPQVDTHWFSESGDIDVFFLLGSKPMDVARQYSALTGTTQLPPLFSLAYHQCRWNYNDEADVKGVDNNADKFDIPMDVIWLDIEHTDGKRYFTWDSLKFPDSRAMIDHVAAKGRKMVTIVDPHIKSDDNYAVYKEGRDQGLFIKDKSGNDYDGWCWPGSSRWMDFVRPEVRDYWAGKFSLTEYPGSTPDLYTWNDMNEPSVFNGPEITMHKDALHLDGVEHREVHNLYGVYTQRATAEGQVKRSGDKLRPFVLTRAFFAGSQRYGAVWTGDNTGEWDHLKASVPMLLSLSISGITFCGADVGGFFKNPDGELITRWYQAGAYQPFFRAHAHLDTKRREPWLFDKNNLDAIRFAIKARYSLLPLWYTLFYENEKKGFPVMRPLFFHYPTDKQVFGIDDQYLIGYSLLVKPITWTAASSVEVYLPGQDEVWYYVEDYKQLAGDQTISMNVNLNTIPVFQRGGSVVPRKFRVRRASALTHNDPYTLIVCLDKHGQASGTLFIDDYESFDYNRRNSFKYMEYNYVFNQLRSTSLVPDSQFSTRSWLERVMIAGLKAEPKAIELHPKEGADNISTLDYSYNDGMLVIRKPGMNMLDNWMISLIYDD